MKRFFSITTIFCSLSIAPAFAAGIGGLGLQGDKSAFESFRADLNRMAASLPEAKVDSNFPDWLSGALPELISGDHFLTLISDLAEPIRNFMSNHQLKTIEDMEDLLR